MFANLNVKSSTTFAILALFLFIQTSIVQSSKTDVLSQNVPHLVLTNVSVEKVLTELTTKYAVPIGLEVAWEDTSHASDKITINIEQGTVRDVLNALVKSDARYRWEQIDGIINVFPKLEQTGILDVVVHDFKINGIISTSVVRQAITDSPEVKSKLDTLGIHLLNPVQLSIGVREVKRSFSINLQNVTVRSILNQIAKSGNTNYWVVSRFGQNNEFLIINF